MRRDPTCFAVMTFIPAALLLAGAAGGVWWSGAALAYMTAATYLVDALAPRDAAVGVSSRGADALCAALAGAHFVLLAAAVMSIAGPGDTGAGGRIVAFFAFGLWFGQVSNPNAHELIHRASPVLRGVGKWVYISLLFGHHTSAHPAVHHRFAATPLDPNTALLGESFYHFLPRAWRGSLIAGLQVEVLRLARRGLGAWHWSNPYWSYVGGAVVLLAVSWALAGMRGVAVHAGLAFYAQAQLLLSDYVQHYGLERARHADGRFEPVSARHSWNSPHWMSAMIMLNAPRHSDHHAHPARPYPALRDLTAEGAPVLPWSLPVSGAVALMPGLWRRVMNARLGANGAGRA